MRLIITEEQLRLIIESEGEDNLLDFTPFMNAVPNRWDGMFSHLNKKKGGIYTGYYISGDLILNNSKIETLGNLESVGGNLDLDGSLIKSLGNLKSVGGNLYLSWTTIDSLSNLKSVGGHLYLYKTPLSKNTTEEELRNKINVGGNIYL